MKPLPLQTRHVSCDFPELLIRRQAKEEPHHSDVCRVNKVRKRRGLGDYVSVPLLL